jgi:hypothetical protein
MRRASFLFGATIATSVLLGLIPSANAWYDHTALMDGVQKRLEREYPQPGPTNTWNGPLPANSASAPNRYYELAGLLLLQSHAAANLPSNSARTIHEFLRLGAEDPDHGMDADLPDSADPSDDRKFMGGTKGPGSQGFRHEYWAGWTWHHPLATLQYPARTLGQAPDRIELLANEARDRYRKGNIRDAVRILGWTIHYLQDLTEPFHTAELPTTRMIPWSALLVWPPTDAFDSFLANTSRVVTNYHWAYEGYVRHALLAGDANPFRECFEKSGGSILVASPRELALEVARQSTERAHKTGRALIALVGTHLKDPGVSMPADPGQIDNEDLLKNPDHASARERLNAVTCDSLRLATDATIWITRWVFAR